MNKTKEYKITILFAVLCAIFLIGSCIPYFNSDYKRSQSQFMANYDEYYRKKDEAESYEDQAYELDGKIALATIANDNDKKQLYIAEQNRLERLSELTDDTAEAYYQNNVAPYFHESNAIRDKRLVMQIISGVLSFAFLICGVISICLIKKKKRQSYM